MKSLFTILLLSLLISAPNFAESPYDFQGNSCENVDAGTVSSVTGQTRISILIDGNPDIIAFNTTANTASEEFKFAYIVTRNDVVIEILAENIFDFESLGVGVCRVFGIAYTGDLILEVGDNIHNQQGNFSTDCSDISDNSVLIIRLQGSGQTTVRRFFASSNTNPQIGIYNILEGPSGTIVSGTIESVADDADGIFYDESSNVLYQLNRTDNVINAYSDVNQSLNMGANAPLTATSSSDFSNGREIAFANGKLIVAQDGNDTNGGNKLIIYDASPTAITLDKVLDIDINLWGIVLNGNTLYAVEDNSSNVVVIDKIFDQEGSVEISQSISVDGLVRTHGLVYVPEDDMMLLTDIGDADSATDGALIRVKKFTQAASDGVINQDEQIRVEGGSSQLGNPVDVAYDPISKRVYIAERKRNDGMILCFNLPVVSGPIAPTYAQSFPGASAVYLAGLEVDACENIEGGNVSLANGGTETTILVDGVSDIISFTSSMIPTAASFTYVVTDSEGKILGIPPGNSVDFDPAGLGTCFVYGVSYVGELLIQVGDDFPNSSMGFSDICADVSENRLTINRIAVQQSDVQFYTSSNTSGEIGVFNVFKDDEIAMTSFASEGMDADGIFYDESSDVLYQLNRTDNVVNAYSNVKSSLGEGSSPTLSATSSSDFTNGRGIAFSNGKIVVAQDEDETNGGNKFIIYDVSPTAITLDKVLDADIALWGIQASGSTLFAVEDNSNRVAVYSDFFSNEAGAVSATTMASVEGLVRTHGLTYISEFDMMFLTDIGDASNANDGALVRIRNFTETIADGTVTADEQIRVEGSRSFLGNPVDIAYDQVNRIVYVAERATNGGMILGFKLPVLTGGIAPIYRKLSPGVSAIDFPGSGEPACDVIDGGAISLSTGGTETTIVVDGFADLLSFNSTSMPSPAGTNYAFVITDANGIILGIPPTNSADFDDAGLGLCRVYGVSYAGNLLIERGDNFLSAGQLSDNCFSVSSNSLTINRIAPGTTDIQFFTSSNTSGQIGVFGILDNKNIVESSFASAAMDADGIFYDEENDVLYQLNRTNNVIDIYGAVNESLANGMTPSVLTSSTSDFSNGREIAVVDGKLVVSQDASDSNDGNKLVVYDITPTSITYDKEYTVDIDLWGIFATGNTLFAVEDNSSNVAVYSDFFNTPAGALTPTNLVMVEDMVRTHGLFYDFHDDMLVLTDIGDAASDDKDGAIVVIRNFEEVSADGFVSSDEQARAFGGSSQLANPVDIALDKPGKIVYVAERKQNGGTIYGFKLPKLTGGIAPEYTKTFSGASAVHLPGLEVGICEIANGGEITLETGDTETTIFIDGNPDLIAFATTVPDVPVGFNFTYVVTDEFGKILGIPSGNEVDFEGAGVGVCYVYGLSYLGDLSISTDDILTDIEEYSTDCSDLSDNRLTINRIEPVPAAAQLFASSNTASQIGVFNILENNAKVTSFIEVMNADADGIYYDSDSDVLYQLNRSENVLHAYGDVGQALAAGTIPKITATSTPNFSNGREIAWIEGRIIVADDASDTNSGNRLLVYDASATEISLDKIFLVDINLWGIVAEGSTLYAVQDNSSNVAVYENILDNSTGNVSTDAIITVENLVRTHGITYDAASDKMILTDIGDAEEDEDGAIVLIDNWSTASVDLSISEMEQVRVDGDSTLLGNPVDVAYDAARGTVYVAERANNGGRILGFEMSDIMDNEYKPGFIYNFEGASAVNISGDLPVLKGLEVADREVTAVVNKLYPSPASESVNLSLESTENLSTVLQIFDMTGKLIQTHYISLSKGGNLINLNVANLSSGFHFISIPSIDYSEKFLKIK